MAAQRKNETAALGKLGNGALERITQLVLAERLVRVGGRCARRRGPTLHPSDGDPFSAKMAYRSVASRGIQVGCCERTGGRRDALPKPEEQVLHQLLGYSA